MTREDLEHLIRAASAITNEYDLVIIGSQSILGKYPNAPKGCLQSNEADLMVLGDLEKAERVADLIDGSIGECSPFMECYGYYAQGVVEGTAVLPKGWKERLVKIQNQNTNLKVGWCLDPLDLACSKLIASREKDIHFIKEMLKHDLINQAEFKKRLENMDLEASKIKQMQEKVDAMGSKLNPRSRPKTKASN